MPEMQSIGQYILGEELGRGAMGVVFRGFDPAIGLTAVNPDSNEITVTTAVRQSALKLLPRTPIVEVRRMNPEAPTVTRRALNSLRSGDHVTVALAPDRRVIALIIHNGPAPGGATH